MKNIYSYTDRPEPDIGLLMQLPHPTDTGVIGHVAFNHATDEVVGMFPRTRAEHYFRKFGGYAISVDVLNRLDEQGAEAVYIVERDRDNRFIEFDIASFRGGTHIAYSPSEDTIIERPYQKRLKHKRASFSDHQRVCEEVEAITVWQRDEVTLRE